MNTFWLKIAGLVIVVLVVIFLVKVFSSKSEPEPDPRPKTFWDQIEEDEKKVRAEPQLKEPPGTKESVQPKNDTRTVKPAKPEFKKLSPEQEIQAQKLFEWALSQRKMARLPGMSYKKMVDACREIIEKYPDTIYSLRAKRLLADIPERHRKLYNITEEEIDLGDWK